MVLSLSLFIFQPTTIFSSSPVSSHQPCPREASTCFQGSRFRSPFIQFLLLPLQESTYLYFNVIQLLPFPRPALQSTRVPFSFILFSNHKQKLVRYLLFSRYVHHYAAKFISSFGKYQINQMVKIRKEINIKTKMSFIHTHSTCTMVQH